LLAVRALRHNPWLQQALLAKYPVLVVDEYQDLGVALHRLVMGLCIRAGMRLFAVGDVDQSIYGFTGARPDLLRRLSEREDVGDCASAPELPRRKPYRVRVGLPRGVGRGAGLRGGGRRCARDGVRPFHGWLI